MAMHCDFQSSPPHLYQDYLIFPTSLPHPLLPLINLCLPPLLTLNLSHEPLILLFVFAISLLLLLQSFSCHKIRVFPQLSKGAFTFTLMFCFQLAILGPLTVWVVVAVRVVVVFKFGDEAFDREGAMVV